MEDHCREAPEALDLSDLAPERRAESLRRAFRFLSSGEEFFVKGTGDPTRYRRFLDREFPSGVIWQPHRDTDGDWLASVQRRPETLSP